MFNFKKKIEELEKKIEELEKLKKNEIEKNKKNKLKHFEEIIRKKNCLNKKFVKKFQILKIF